jgi:GxxExxY protein
VLTGHVVGAALKIHTRLGPGLLESAYRACLVYELHRRGLLVQAEVPLMIRYDGLRLDVGYRLDVLVENVVLVELKAIRQVRPIHQAQLLSYLKLGEFPVGLLINFHVRQLRDGITRMLHDQAR